MSVRGEVCGDVIPPVVKLRCVGDVIPPGVKLQPASNPQEFSKRNTRQRFLREFYYCTMIWVIFPINFVM